jgi:hypothetical protein
MEKGFITVYDKDKLDYRKENGIGIIQYPIEEFETYYLGGKGYYIEIKPDKGRFLHDYNSDNLDVLVSFNQETKQIIFETPFVLRDEFYSNEDDPIEEKIFEFSETLDDLEKVEDLVGKMVSLWAKLPLDISKLDHSDYEFGSEIKLEVRKNGIAFVCECDGDPNPYDFLYFDKSNDEDEVSLTQFFVALNFACEKVFGKKLKNWTK